MAPIHFRNGLRALHARRVSHPNRMTNPTINSKIKKLIPIKILSSKVVVSYNDFP
jgi:hypothetical protein